MKITYTLSTNFSFDYWCPVCGVLMGNSKDDTQLSHPLTRDEWVKNDEKVTFRNTPECRSATRAMKTLAFTLTVPRVFAALALLVSVRSNSHNAPPVEFRAVVEREE